MNKKAVVQFVQGVKNRLNFFGPYSKPLEGSLLSSRNATRFFFTSHVAMAGEEPGIFPLGN